MSTISDIKERIDVVALLSEYVQLSKAGKNFKGLCPFHSEKHASFFVFPDRQTWRCFGSCGEGGDIFSFIMKKENLEFREALELLAARAGVQVDRGRPADAPADEARERLLTAVDTAAEYFRTLLLDSDSAEKAREYFARRNIDIHAETASVFKLGYSPDGWNDLGDVLRARGYSEKELVDAGLAIEREGGGTYDRFRDRLMFPILEASGRVIGFGARAIGDAQPKYINSPQSRVFDKGKVLYGIHRARTAARRLDRIILVEGYTDVLQAHQHGWENVVAPMGTSLTEDQASGLAHVTKNIYLALDADTAGQNAAMKTIRETTGRFRGAFGQKTVAEMGPKGKTSFRTVLDADIRVIIMPAGSDPDETIAANPEMWTQLVDQATPYVDFYVDTLVRSADVASARGKRELISQCEPIIAELEDAMERSRFYSQLSRALQIPEREVMAELSRNQRLPGTSTIRQRLREERNARKTRGDAKEEYCLSLLLSNPQLRPFATGLTAEHFEATENRHLFNAWNSSIEDADIRSQLDASLAEHLDYLLSEPFPPGIPKDEDTQRLALDDCILHLQERHSKRLQFAMETTLNRQRRDEGVEAELAALDHAGHEPTERLHEIFVQQGRRGRTRRS